MIRPTLYAFELTVGRLVQHGSCYSSDPAGAVRVVARRFADTWLASNLPAVVSIREVGSRRTRPELVQEVRA